MWFLKFWAISTGVCFLIFSLVIIAAACEYQRLYTITKKNTYYFVEYLVLLIQMLIISGIPLLNIIWIIAIVLMDKTEMIKNIAIKNGAVLKNNE